MRFTWFLGLICLVVWATGFGSVNIRADSASDDALDARIAAMSLEHKVAQMFMVRLYGSVLTDVGRDLLQTWQPGAVVLLATDDMTPAQITRLTNNYQMAITEAGGSPLLIAVDQEGGVISRLKTGFTTWPVPMLLTAADDADLAFRAGQGMARELRAVGINMNLAPVADLDTNINNPVIGRRAPGSIPDLVGRAVTNFALGMEAGGVLATVKHFPGHGDTLEDSHTTLPVVHHDRARLDAVELVPFAAAVEAGVGAVMTAHIWFPAFDPIDVLPSSLSYNIVTGLLRDEMGYDGIIMTDALDMDAVDTVYSPERAALMAIEAGNDLVLIGAHVGETVQIRAMQAVVDAVRAGEIDEARIDESVRRILKTKNRLGLLEWTLLAHESAEDRIDTAASSLLVEEIFRAGVTVAFDAADRIPLQVDDSIGVVFPGNRAMVQRECGQYSSATRWLAVSDSPTDSEIASAVGLVQNVDTLVVFTRDAYHNPQQQALINALSAEKVIVVALVSPYDWLRFPDVSGYVAVYSPLDAGVEAACAILFGAEPARGQLAVDLDLLAGD